MKKALLLFSAIGFAGLAGAQVVENLYAPDFTVTPLNNGQTPFNLYSELNAGRPVILDVSATWCGPCWNYHNTHKLDDLFDQYGPSGTNELNVIWVEGDAQTTDANMNGQGGNTQGDWITGTTIPMANPSSPTAINNGYGVAAFPTLFIICPNRKVEKFSQSLTVAQIYAKAMSCPVSTETIDVAPFGYKGEKLTCGDLENTIVTIQNMGSTNLTSATITAKNGATVLGTQPWSGNLAKYGVADVNLGSIPFGASSGTLTIEVATNNDAVTANNNLTQAITVAVDQQDDKYNLEVKLDAYANEVFVRLYDSQNQTVFQKQYASADNNKTYSYPIDLDIDECYKLKITDSYGDGLLSNGYVRLAKLTGTAIYTASGSFSEKNYGLIPKAETVGGVSIEEVEGVDGLFNVFPNPATDVLNTSLTLSAAEMVNFRIVNAQGQTVIVQNVQMNAGESVYTIDISGLAAGMYSLQLTADNQVTAKAFIKK